MGYLRSRLACQKFAFQLSELVAAERPEVLVVAQAAAAAAVSALLFSMSQRVPRMRSLLA